MGRKNNMLWNKNWHQQGWVVAFVLLLLLFVAWGFWASAYGTTVAYRDAEIMALIKSKHDWDVAKVTLDRRKQIILANPLSYPYPEMAWEEAEKGVQAAQTNFEEAGFKALYGELIIISAVLFQIILALILTKAIAHGLNRIRKGKNAFAIENLREHWTEKIRIGHVLRDEDEILKLIDDKAANPKLSWADGLRGQQVIDAYKKLMAKCRKARREEIPWLQISNSLYKLALICKSRTGRGENIWEQWEWSIRDQYQEVRRIIQQDVREAAYSAIFTPIMFISVFTILNLYWNALSGETLGRQLVFWRDPVLWFGAAFVANGIVRVWGASFANWLTEKTWTELNDVIVSAIKGPLSALAMAIFLVRALTTFGPATPPFEFTPFLTWVMYEATANILRTMVVIFVGTWFISFFANLLTTNILISWTSVSKQTIDKVVIDLAQLVTTSLIVTISIVITLTIIQDSIRKAIGTDLTTLLSIFVAIIAAVVGYASRFIFENLLGGISLQIEKPFEVGDRIQLPDGRLCEVVTLGLRRTLLHNIDDSSEVAIPNSELVRWSITNTSRMDSSRINVKIWIADPSQVKLAQEIMLDIAYLEKEIDQMRVFRNELSVSERDKMRENLSIGNYRITIEEGMERLARRYLKIRRAVVSQIVGGSESEPEYIFDRTEDTGKDPWRKVLTNIASSWDSYRRIVEDEEKWLFYKITKVEDDKANEVLKIYRRAVSDVVYSESMASPSALSTAIRDIAIHEHIDIKKLLKMLRLLSGVKSIKSGVGKGVLKKIQVKLKEFEFGRLGIVANISENVAIFENYIYAIGEQYPDISPELDGILGEMAREPSVSSEYSDNGHVRLTLSCYVICLERGLEIQHKLNREIGRRFKNAGIRLGS